MKQPKALKLTKSGVNLLRRVRKQILKEPKQFEMAHFFTSRLVWKDEFGKLAYGEPPNCGTAACIGGWVSTLGNRYKNPKEARNTSVVFVEDSAVKLLFGSREVTRGLAAVERLFFAGMWPKPFGEQWEDNEYNLEARAEIAAKRITAFIRQYEPRERSRG